jgi:SagB-type dehydrogenase family enzyme
VAPRKHQQHYSVANITLTRELAEPFHAGPLLPLPPPDPLCVPVPWLAGGRARSLGIVELATLLYFAGGVDERRPGAGRIPANGGGLGSPELFAVVRAVDGLAPGIYHYYSPRHALERLRDPAPALLEAAIGDGEAPLVLVGGGSLGRVEHKYGGFGYRVINLDAGLVLQYLRLTAAALGLRPSELPELHDGALAELLALPSTVNRMLPTFALAIGQGQARRPFHQLGPDLVDEVVTAVLAQSARQSAARQIAAFNEVRQNAARQIAAFNEVRQNAALPVEEQLGPVLLRRRSQRAFSPRPLDAGLVRELGRLVAAVPAQRIAEGGVDLDLRAWLAVRGGDLADGIYAVGRDGDLALHRAGCTREAVSLCFLQKALAGAPVMVCITGDFERVVARGVRGYRELLVHAGAMAAEALVVATAHGLVGCPSGGLMEDGLRALAGFDGYRRCPLFLVAIGHGLEVAHA